MKDVFPRGNPHGAKMNHLIICAMIDSYPNKNDALLYIKYKLGKRAYDIANSIFIQHWDEYQQLLRK